MSSVNSIFVSAIIFFLVTGCSEINGKEISLMSLNLEREKNSFFLVEASVDEKVCTRFMGHLNKPKKHDFFENKKRLNEGQEGKINLGTPEMILQTDLNFPRSVVDGKKSGSMRVEEFLIDFNGDGVSQVVYRTVGSLSGVWVHDLFILPTSYDEKKHSYFGSFMNEQRGLGNVSELSWKFEDFGGLKSVDFLRKQGSQKVFELIKFEGDYYILVTSSMFKNHSPIGVALVKFFGSEENLYPACFFMSNFDVVVN